eukprot:821066-Pyramimonas_sp.AAC.2
MRVSKLQAVRTSNALRWTPMEGWRMVQSADAEFVRALGPNPDWPGRRLSACGSSMVKCLSRA